MPLYFCVECGDTRREPHKAHEYFGFVTMLINMIIMTTSDTYTILFGSARTTRVL